MLCFRRDTPSMILEIGIPTKISWKSRNGGFAIGTIDGSTIALFAFVTGWFVYGGLNPAFGMLAFAAIITVASIMGIIPLAGPFAYWFLVRRDILPRAIGRLGEFIDSFETWPVDVIFYIGLANAILATLVSIFLIYRKLSDRANSYERRNPNI